MGHVFHSTTLIGNPAFSEIQNYIGATSHNLLNEMGFDLTGYSVFTTEFWVQEFAKKGVDTILYTPIGMDIYLDFIF